MTGRKQQLLLHFAGCAIFLALPFLFSPESLNLHSYLTNPPTQRDIIAYVLVLGVFYANYYLLIPRFYFRRKYLLFLSFNLLAFGVVTFLPRFLLPRRDQPSFVNLRPDPSQRRFDGPGYQPDGPGPVGPSGPNDRRSTNAGPGSPGDQPGPPPFDSLRHQPGPYPSGFRYPPSFRRQFPGFIELNEHFFVFLVVLFLALLLKIRDRWIRAEEEKLHAELAYLKTQINPHFLFNTLNSIYAMALGKSEQTAGAIVRLSSMMRYVLTDTGREKVAVKQEIAYLIDYIELQKTRFEGTLLVDLSIIGDPGDKQIVPLLLIPFVENAFKYGVNPEEPSTIRISIDIRDHELLLLVANKKVAPPQPDADPRGLGIKNTRERLQLLYPGQYTLELKDGEKDFTVSLNLSGI
jgi:Histidine kinase